MQRVRPPHRAALVVGALLLAGCVDSSPVAPPVRASLDLAAEEASPDSGEVVVYPSDGPAAAAPGAAQAFGVAAATPAPGPTIRIGVIQSATEIALGSAGAWTLRDKANGLVLLTGAGGAVQVTIAEAAISHFRLQVMCGSLARVQERKDAADAAGVVTFTEFVPTANCTRLFLGEFASNASFSVRNAFRNQMIALGLSGTDSFWKIVTVGGGTVYQVTRGTAAFRSLNPVVLTANDGGTVTIGGRNGAVALATLTYRGKAEARQSGVALAGINELPMEEYLYGVVPRELGPVQYPEIEAQKAQAIAARTYALRGRGKRASDGYDLRATVDDQVYGGHSAEHPVSTRAVDETAGIAARVGGQLIDALFSSTSGGHTADSEEAFTSVLSYLRGVPDAERGEALEYVPSLATFRAHANPQSLRAVKEGDFESDWARFHRWTFEWTMDEISGVLSTWAGQPVGHVHAITVLERGPSGRATRIEYVTDAGTFTDTRDRIRSSLRYINASGNPANLLSTLFFIEPVHETGTGALAGFRVYGGGFGHGVGLAQTGAVGMAQKGRTYEEILRHYYRGIELTTGY